MNCTKTLATLRILGTLGGLLGGYILCFMPWVVNHAITRHDPWVVVINLLPLAFGVYLLYITYLVWFRFSPKAVRHVCGTTGFFVLVMVSAIREVSPTPLKPLAPLLLLPALLIVYYGYRAVTERLNRVLFPQKGPAAPVK